MTHEKTIAVAGISGAIVVLSIAVAAGHDGSLIALIGTLVATLSYWLGIITEKAHRLMRIRAEPLEEALWREDDDDEHKRT